MDDVIEGVADLRGRWRWGGGRRKCCGRRDSDNVWEVTAGLVQDDRVMGNKCQVTKEDGIDHGLCQRGEFKVHSTEVT